MQVHSNRNQYNELESQQNIPVGACAIWINSDIRNDESIKNRFFDFILSCPPYEGICKYSLILTLIL